MKSNRGTIATNVIGTLLMSLIGLVSTAAAKVVYTPVNMSISGTGSIPLDLNNDGNPDFVLDSTSGITYCGNRGGFSGSTTIGPAFGNGVVVSQLNHAAILPNGFPIDSKQLFFLDVATVMQFACLKGSIIVSGYLGLEGHVNGQTRYGWAEVRIYAFSDGFRNLMTTSVYGVAFETIPGKSILTGQTSDQLDDARNIPESPSSPSVLVPVHQSHPFQWSNSID